MININRFLIGEIVYHCDTEEKANHLLKELDKKGFKGFKWNSGRKLTEKNYWEVHRKATCYEFFGGVKFGHVDYYKRNKYQIVKYETERRLYTAEMIAELDIYRNKVFQSVTGEKMIVSVREGCLIFDYDQGNYDIYTDSVNLNRLWTEVVEEKTYIEGWHFGSNQIYTWEVPTDLEDKIKEGQIVEVDTIQGPKLVEIARVYKDITTDKHKEVLKILNWEE